MPHKKQKQPQPRPKWLQTILGKSSADEVDKILSDLSRAISNAGVESKAVRLARTKGVMETMQSDLKKTLSKYVDEPDTKLVNDIIATVLSSMLPVSDDPLDDEVIEEMEGEDEDEDEYEDDVPILEEMMGDEEPEKINGQVKKQYGYLVTIAKNIRIQNEVMESLVKVINELSDEYKGLRGEMNSLSKKVNATPRRVTENKGGVVNNQSVSEVMKNAPSEIYDDFWGGRKIGGGS